MLALLVPVAMAQSTSEPQPLVFEDEAPVLTGLQVDSGWFPSPDDPLAIRFYVLPRGGVHTRLEGDSQLAWDPPPAASGVLRHRAVGRPDGARIALDTVVDIGIDVQIDVDGVLTDVVTLAGTEMAFDAEVAHDGLLLPGQPPAAELRDVRPPLELSTRLDVIPGVHLDVGVDVAPILTADVRGIDVTTDAFGIPREQDQEGQWVDVPAPPGASELGLTSAWTGLVTGALELGLAPEVRLDTPVGSFRILRVRVPIAIQRFDEVRTTEGVFVVHPLPGMDLQLEEHDFGEVLLGEVALLEVPIRNLGLLPLAGAAEVDGPGAFGVFPEHVTAGVEGEDGLVVTFAPEEPGAVRAEVVLTTNDPWQPRVVVAVRGVGVAPPGEDGRFAGISTCGCASPGHVPAGLWGLLLVAWFRVRRRSAS